MSHLTDSEKQELFAPIEAGLPLPERWPHRLFTASWKAVKIGKECRFEYQGKM